MISRRGVLAGFAGLGALSLSACANRPSTMTADGSGGNIAPSLPAAPAIDPHAHLDAVIDVSHSTTVYDFSHVRNHSNILAVLHKASEGGDWRDPLYAERRDKALAAGLLWGAYHFGTHQYSGADQAQAFLAMAQPAPDTLMALDLELNERIPANTMTIDQAEAFVTVIKASTGRLPLLYTHAIWAEGKPVGRQGRSLGGAISSRSILAECDLWLADYRSQPQLPSAWSGKGWRLWQYAGEGAKAISPPGSPGRSVAGVDRCDRNVFLGDATALVRYWCHDGGRRTIS
ncbi:MAG TPA: glycoside hydrolase family 25 protein [Telmatospirillum sp.]|nr:glycoside hydrolase family 25 protein [Telmatospirillum sp.]